jgi:hypothetical protein
MRNKSKLLVAIIAAVILVVGLSFSPIFSHHAKAEVAKSQICDTLYPNDCIPCHGPKQNCMCEIVVTPPQPVEN